MKKKGEMIGKVGVEFLASVFIGLRRIRVQTPLTSQSTMRMWPMLRRISCSRTPMKWGREARMRDGASEVPRSYAPL